MNMLTVKKYLTELWHGNKGFIFAVLAIFVVRSIVIDQYHVPSGSMEPTIQIGDRLVVNKMAYQLRVPFTSILITPLNELKRGDIVVFDHPNYRWLTLKDGMIERVMLLMGQPVKIGLNESGTFDITTKDNLATVYAEIKFKNGKGSVIKKDPSVEFTVNGVTASEANTSHETEIKIAGRTISFGVEVEGKVMVKRLVGVPGDRMAVMKGKIFINDEPTTIGVLTNPSQPFHVYMKERIGEHTVVIQRIPSKATASKVPEFMEFTVPEDSYFFMGDNRDDSADSRYWGFVPRSLIKGKALNVTFSLDGFSPRWSRFGQSLYKDLSAETLP